MMNYAQQIKHPLWQKKRLEVLEFRGFKCQTCENADETLHVHHPFYKRGAMIWDYDKEELMCLCSECHKNEHIFDERFKKKLALASLEHKKQAVAYLEALMVFNHVSAIGDKSYAIAEGVSDALRPRASVANMNDMFWYFISQRDGGEHGKVSQY